MLFPVIEVENYAFRKEAVQNSHWKFIHDFGVSVISEVAGTVRIWMKPANYDEGSFIDQYSGSNGGFLHARFIKPWCYLNGSNTPRMKNGLAAI